MNAGNGLILGFDAGSVAFKLVVADLTGRILQHTYTRTHGRPVETALAQLRQAVERHGGHWRAAIAEAGIDADWYLFRDRSADAVLPWDIIDGGLKASFFRAEYEKSLRAEWTLPPKRLAENARLLPVLG